MRRILLLLSVAIILAALAAAPAFSRVIVLPNSTPCDQAANQALIVEKTKEKECVVSTPPSQSGAPHTTTTATTVGRVAPIASYARAGALRPRLFLCLRASEKNSSRKLAE
jgi:hypothetical protein